MRPSSQNVQLRVGIAGLGGIAKRTHLPVLQMLPGYQVVCGAEKDDYQCERVCCLFNLEESYQDFMAMIEKADIDAIFVCLPATLHKRAVLAALERGLHVFCEKPMGVSPDEANAMVLMAEKTGKLLMPGYNLRYVDNFIRARNLIVSGKLGRILQINATYMNPGPYISWDPKSDWYLDRSSHGALYDIGSHLVDLLLYLYPHRIKRLFASASQGYQPYEAVTNISCSYEGEGGLLGSIQIGWRTASEVCRLDFHGTAGTLSVGRRHFSYTHGATDPANRISISLDNAAREIGALLHKINRMRKGLDVLEEFLRQGIEFWNHLAKGKPDLSKAHDAIHVHEILRAILSSITDERTVFLE